METSKMMPVINSCTIGQLVLHLFIKHLLTTYYVPALPISVENEVNFKNKISKDGNEE